MEEQKLDLILNELRNLNNRVTNIEQNMATKDELAEMKKIMATKDELAEMKIELSNIKQNMATKDDVADINFIKQAVIEINQDVKQILEDQKSIHEILGEHEVAIRSLRRKPV